MSIKKKPAKKNTKKLQKEFDQGYCRRCQRILSLKNNFYTATNPLIDSNGFLSVCSNCCNDIYDHYFSIYGNMADAIHATCQDLDVRFSEQVLEQALSHIEKLISSGRTCNTVFGYYKSKLGSTGKNNEGLDSFRYKDSDPSFIDKRISIQREIAETEISDELILFWGNGFTSEDYIFLEAELANWKQTHKCDNQAEITLLKEICIKVLTIRKKRALEDNVSSDLKELQELMKTSNVDPAKANIASAGKLHETFGIWIKDIEQFKPAEWHDKQEKYKDMDGFVPYIVNYIARPIKNFITGNRDFLINDNATLDLDDFDDSTDIGG